MMCGPDDLRILAISRNDTSRFVSRYLGGGARRYRKPPGSQGSTLLPGSCASWHSRDRPFNHALAELFATVTALPTRPQHSPAEAKSLVDGVAELLTVYELLHDDYTTALKRMVEHDLSSGAIYDALHVVAAEKTEAKELVTFNGSDFWRMPPKGTTELTVLSS